MIEELHINEEAKILTLAQRLKLDTTTTHDSLDKMIMTKRPFTDLGRYALFLAVQYRFHLAIAPLYCDPKLLCLFTDLPERARLSYLKKDYLDLNADINDMKAENNLPNIDYPASLGWLYVSEGSNLGAEYLLKAAKRIGLSEEFGATHLAPAAIGRGQSWKVFTTALNAIELTYEQQSIVIDGARDAFSLVRSTVDSVFE